MSYSHQHSERRLCAAVLVALCVPAFAACSGPAAGTSPVPSAISLVRDLGVRHLNEAFNYQTIDDPQDPTTEVLGINNLGKIVGYYGDGPTDGFYALAPYGPNNFKKIDYPGAVSTVATAVNNSRAIAGWYQNNKGWIFGFILWEGIWTTYKDSHLRGSPTQNTQIWGLSDDGLAVGFYRDSSGTDHAFEMDETTGKFHGIFPPNAKNSAATGISGKGDVVGWLTLANGTYEGWLLKGGHYTVFSEPSGSQTQPYSVNWEDDIVGSYVDGSGNTHGFILSNPLTSQQWQQIDEPNAANYTVVTGVNDHHTMVGYYKDGSGNIDGFLASLKSGT